MKELLERDYIVGHNMLKPPRKFAKADHSAYFCEN